MTNSTIRKSAVVTAIAAVLMVLAAGIAWARGPLDLAAVKLPEMTPALNLGKLNYDAKCASCHGLNGAGTDKGPTFLHRVYHPGHHGDGAFFLAPRRGVRAHHWPYGDMPPVPDVSDAQIEKIVLYVRALQRVNGIY
jgi:mono/diheme cytochrome c family protein